MAKYEVTMKCGHTEEVELIGKTSERESKIAWMESTCICKSCKEAKYQEENKKAAEASKEAHLPELTGSEKQIAWATTIRQTKVTELNARLATAKEKAPEQAAVVQAILDNLLAAMTASSYWIDNRDTKSVNILAAYEQSQK